MRRKALERINHFHLLGLFFKKLKITMGEVKMMSNSVTTEVRKIKPDGQMLLELEVMVERIRASLLKASKADRK